MSELKPGKRKFMLPEPHPSLRKIRRIRPLQAGKILAVLYGAFGLIVFPFIMLASVFAPPEQRVGIFGAGIFMALLFPVMYAVLGFIFGIVGAAIYNLAAGWVGGIEVEVE